MTVRRYWLAAMLDRLPSFITTATPVVLLGLNAGLEALGQAHVGTGGEVQLVAAGLVLGNFLRRSLESGQLARVAKDVDAQYAAIAQPIALSKPLQDLHPSFGADLPLGPPPGSIVPDDHLIEDVHGNIYERREGGYVLVKVAHVS